MAPTFGTSDESNLDAAHLQLFLKVDKNIAGKLIGLHLNDILALPGATDFVCVLLDNDLLVLAAVVVWFSSDEKPSKQDVIDFFTTLGITWVHGAGAARDRDHMLVAMRVLQFYHYCLELEATRLKGGSTTCIAHDAHDFSNKLIFFHNVAHGSPHQTLGCK